MLIANLTPCTSCGGPRASISWALCAECRRTETSEEQRVKGIARAYANVYQNRGHLTPEPCQACGTTTDGQKHHHDYSKPLDVEWLCRGCHGALHTLERLQSVSQETEPT